jgi:hypothetical protein
MDTALLAVSVVTVVFTGGAVWYARGGKLAASRSAAAAESSALEAKRSADAAHEAVGYQRDEVERNRVVFRLEPGSQEMRLLRNAGTHSAYCVHVDTGDLGGEPVTDYDEFESGRAEPYVLPGSLASMTNSIVVTWHHLADCSDEPRQAQLPWVRAGRS